MKFEISHRTLYDYGSAVVRSQHLVHLEPRNLPYQRVHHHVLAVEPTPVSRSARVDYFGNHAVGLRIDVEHYELVIHALSTVEVQPRAVFELSKSRAWEEAALLASDSHGLAPLDVVQYATVSRHTNAGPELADYTRMSFPAGRPIMQGAMSLTQRIFEEFTFDATATDVSTPISKVFSERRGVCQDFSHLMIAGLKALGIPARYVSGYILTHPPPGKPRLQGADASHAWVSVWCPDHGWVDFDPTNGIMPSQEHITIGFGRDYDDVNPVSGVLLGGHEHAVHVEVDVVPVK